MEIVLLIVGVLFGWLAASALEYAKAKGKNLADKEDIQKLTKLVEDVKQENALLLESLRSRQQLRMAAAEKRLQVHQEAFTMWRGMIRTIHEPNAREIASIAQQWWESNCLYLTAEARSEFMEAYTSLSQHQMILDGPRTEETKRLAQDNYRTIMKAGITIVEGVNLPTLGEKEAARLDPKSQGANARSALTSAVTSP